MSKSSGKKLVNWPLIALSIFWIINCGPKPLTRESPTKAVNFVVTDEEGNLLEGVVIVVNNIDGTSDSYSTNEDGQTGVNITQALPVDAELSYTKDFLPIILTIKTEDFPPNQSRIEKKIQLEKKKTTVFGYVFDKSNSKPIPGDPVRISAPNISSLGSIYTDKQGMYEIESSELFEGAELRIEADVSGYNKNSVLTKIDSLWARNKAPDILLEALPEIGNKIMNKDTLNSSGGGITRIE